MRTMDFPRVSLSGCPLCLLEGELQISVRERKGMTKEQMEYLKFHQFQHVWSLYPWRGGGTLTWRVTGTEGRLTVCADPSELPPRGPNSARNDGFCAPERTLLPLSGTEMNSRYRLGTQRPGEKFVSGITQHQSPADRLFNRTALMSSRHVCASAVSVTTACLWYSSARWSSLEKIYLTFLCFKSFSRGGINYVDYLWGDIF